MNQNESKLAANLCRVAVQLQYCTEDQLRKWGVMGLGSTFDPQNWVPFFNPSFDKSNIFCIK